MLCDLLLGQLARVPLDVGLPALNLEAKLTLDPVRVLSRLLEIPLLVVSPPLLLLLGVPFNRPYGVGSMTYLPCRVKPCSLKMRESSML